MAFQPTGVPPPPTAGDNIGPGGPSPYLHEDKPAFPINAAHRYGDGFFSFLAPVLGPVGSVMTAWQEKRNELDLPSPGTAEHLQREVKSTLLNNFIFDGARADLTKALSMNPIFQVTHAFSMGAQQAPSSYNFGAVYGSERYFLQGGLDDAGSVTIRANTGWADGHISKFQGQMAPAGGQSFAQFEHDYQGRDHSANIKALNPSPIDGTGIYIANYLQSLTRNFALGVEAIWQRPDANQQEAAIGYMVKWISDSKDAIATLQLQGQGIAQATYWHKLAENVSAAADLQLVTAGGRRDAQAALGAKWDFRMATYRAQIDSTGKISSLLETRLAPTLALTFAGEVDHFKNAAKFGVGLSLESAGGEVPLDPSIPPPTPPSVPV
ncbi:Translocase of outer mitochondrial membrane complex, subunit TOM40 [Ceraceosorus bombacis]|uniref:Translocase of outer mitochondrial membrane complex, subunit TOM40 n=1 Tax=Ceraceosorus bombacis TaxID=401625 RepID=A0A0P1BI85_9BASI|nr:Translocase of outer mitochondrial membrane complex, subunit TOM40 [Ceraceosorus bombacis]